MISCVSEDAFIPRLAKEVVKRDILLKNKSLNSRRCYSFK